MKVTFEMSDAYDEALVQIYANTMTDQIREIIQICSEETQGTLFGFKEEQLIPIQKEEMVRFFSLDKKTYCETESEILLIKEVLYKLEERFTHMIRISNSEMINPDFIKDLELSLAGTIKVNLKNGEQTYTSRRYMKEFKRRLGI